MAERPTDAEFDLGEELEAQIKNVPETQRPSIAGLIATAVAKYRAKLLGPVTEKFHNGLSDAQLEVIALLTEECGEVVQTTMKIVRHGLESWHPLRPTGPVNREALEREVGQVLAVVFMLIDLKVLDRGRVQYALRAKLHNVQQWLHHYKVSDAVHQMAADDNGSSLYTLRATVAVDGERLKRLRELSACAGDMPADHIRAELARILMETL